MAHDHRTSKADFPLDEAQRLRQQGQSYQKIADAIGWSMPQTRRYLLGEVTGHGSPQSEPTTTLQRVEYLGEPDGSPGLPDIARQSDLDHLKTRVDVLEAFIATLQQQPSSLPGSPNGSPMVHQVHSGSPGGSPTHKRGFVLADDLWDAIHTYADAHHWQIAQVVDVALRAFFAGVAAEVRRD